MSEVRFLADAHVHDEHGVIIESFKAGAVVDFSKRPASADRWIKRGVAIALADEKVKEEPKDAPNPPAGAKAGADGNGGGNAADDSGAGASGAAVGKSKR